MTKRLVSIFFLFILLFACAQTQPTPLLTQSTASPITQAPPTSWWSDAVFYEIFVRSFYDTDGNGIGDFNGVTQKLDYLSNLGITAIWLMPIHPSPSYHGYDVTNYYAVNPEYGTMEDFEHLLSEAHKLNIRIIIDLVLNPYI
jgi:1,4-alpha-glucan branching enzyme